jgi:hemin uptake protein HemP
MKKLLIRKAILNRTQIGESVEVIESGNHGRIQYEVSKDRILSGDLFAGQQVILIEHGGVTYQLRITKGNKLILTK